MRKAPPSLLDAHPPQHRLADPRVAGQNEPGGPAGNLIEESLNKVKLSVAPDDRPRNHSPILARSASGYQSVLSCPPVVTSMLMSAEQRG